MSLAMLGVVCLLVTFVFLFVALPLLRAGASSRVWAVLLLAMIGAGGTAYWFAGGPGVASAPDAEQGVKGQGAAVETARQALLANPADTVAWVRLSLALGQEGKSYQAAEALHVALKAMPDNVDLWVAYGEALVAHSEGQVTPAARLAFDRASTLAPDHPAPKIYLALAWMQAAQPEQALVLLQEIARHSKVDAPWMPQVNRMMRGAQAMIDAGVSPAPDMR